MTDDPRQHAPAAARNRDPILAVLRALAPSTGTILEVASGTGEHAAHFAAALPAIVFQPTEPDAARRASIDAWCAGLPNVLPARPLDAAGTDWPEGPFDIVLSCNMIHIAPWAAAEGLVAGAGRVLRPGGVLLLYGPFRRQGHPTAPSNEAFDTDLRTRNPAWGLRALEAVDALAREAGFGAPEVTAMPANNLCVAWRQGGA
jgi:SAM-dependent methyltransferase